MDKKTEALKLALEKYMAAYGQALEAYGIELQQQQIEADRFAREALAQPAVAEQHKQEPAFYTTAEGHQPVSPRGKDDFYCVPLYTTPPQRKEPEQEPVAIQYASKAERDLYEMEDEDDTTPPQRTWVGLTDEEVIQIRDNMTLDIRSHIDFYRHIEAKLKEKNT